MYPSSLPNIDLQVLPTFPAHVGVTGVLTLVKSGLSYTFGVNFQNVAEETNVSDMSKREVLVQDTDTGAFWRVKLTNLLTWQTDWANIQNKPTEFPPSPHTHPVSQISDATPLGQALVTAADDAAARGLLGGTIIGSAVFTAPDEATAQAALDVPPNTRTISAGTGLTGGGDLSANRTLSLANMAQATVKGRAAGAGTGAPQDLTISQVLDALGNAQGSIAQRGASGWSGLGPGSAGQVLTSAGPGANLVWTTPAGGDDMAFSTLAMQVADLANQALFLGESGNRVFDSFATLDYVDVAGATNLDTGTPGELKPTSGNPRVTGATPSGLATPAANFNDNNSATSASRAGVDLSWQGDINGRLLARLDLGSVRTITKIEAVNVYQSVGGSADGFSLVYSTDGSTWTQLGATQANSTTPTTFERAGSVSARYVALALKQINWAPATINIAGLNAYEYIVNHMTVASTAFTAASAPASEKITARIIAVDPVTLNTDLMMDVSRDGGTTWTQVTLAEKFTQPGSVKVIESNSVDVSGQPSGVAPRWRIRTANNKMVRIPDMGLYWK